MKVDRRFSKTKLPDVASVRSAATKAMGMVGSVGLLASGLAAMSMFSSRGNYLDRLV